VGYNLPFLPVEVVISYIVETSKNIKYFNKKQKIVKSESIIAEITSTIYTYDDSDRLIECIFMTLNGTGARTLYEYDSRGRMITDSKTDLNGKNIIRIEKKYDDMDNTLCISYISPEGIENTETEYIYCISQ
jgi:hypothetical protein